MRKEITLSEFCSWLISCFIEDITRVIAGALNFTHTNDSIRVSNGGLIHGGDLILRKDRIARQV